MVQGYCGKSCQECSSRGENRCPGCQEGPGGQEYGRCILASCVRSKELQSCLDCRFCNNCGKYADRMRLPELQARESLEQQALAKQQYDRAVVLSKGLKVLFWLIIVSLPLAAVTVLLPSWDAYITGALSLAEAWILFYMGKKVDKYKSAAYLSIAVFGASIVIGLASSKLVVALLGIVVGILEIAGAYYLIHGHVDAMWMIDRGLSYKWERLWKWTVAAMIGSLVSAFLLPLFMRGMIAIIVALLLIFGAVAFSITMTVLELCYLHASAEAAHRVEQHLSPIIEA